MFVGDFDPGSRTVPLQHLIESVPISKKSTIYHKFLYLSSPNVEYLQEIHDVESSIFEQVFRIYSEAFVGPEELNIDQLKKLVKTGKYRLFVLTGSDLNDQSVVIGFIFLGSNNSKTIFNIDYLAINQRVRSKGAGTLMVQLLLSRVKREVSAMLLGVRPKAITLECEKKLISFYNRLGFVHAEIPPSRYPFKVDKTIEIAEFYYLGVSLDDSQVTCNPKLMLGARKSIVSDLHHFLKPKQKAQ